MKKSIIIIAVIIVVGVGAYYIFSNGSSNVAPNAPMPSAQLPSVPTSTVPAENAPAAIPVQTPPTPLNFTVSIKNFSFNPSTVTVKTGTKVTWVNNDGVSHTVTPDSDNLFNSSVLSPGQSFSFTFTDPGSVNYHCKIHPTMKGTVIVEK